MNLDEDQQCVVGFWGYFKEDIVRQFYYVVAER